MTARDREWSVRASIFVSRITSERMLPTASSLIGAPRSGRVITSGRPGRWSVSTSGRCSRGASATMSGIEGSAGLARSTRAEGGACAAEMAAACQKSGPANICRFNSNKF